MTANRQQRRSTASKARKTKGKVVPLNAQEGLRLTDVERLQMENLTLKVSVIQSQTKEQTAPLLAQREQLGFEIGERLGLKIGDYNINLDTGLLELQANKVAAVAAVVKDAVDAQGEALDTAQQALDLAEQAIDNTTGDGKAKI